jgi:hypothetical protein
MTSISMKLATSWEVNGTVIKFLAEQLNKSRLSLVVGAGLSTEFGLPNWQTLIDKLVGQAELPSDFVKQTAKRQASYIKTKIFKNDSSILNNRIREIIYDDAKINFETLQDSKILSSLGALIMASSRGSVSNVITFNYDDILETYLSYYGFTCESTVEGISWTTDKDVVVHHPHGLMPCDKSLPIKGDIILDSSSFHSIMQESSHWKRTVFNIMSSTFPIFIGVSGDDDHLADHVEECKKNHVSLINKELAYWGIWFTTDDQTASAQIWRSLKIFPYKVSNYSEIPSILFKICQESSRNRT